MIYALKNEIIREITSISFPFDKTHDFYFSLILTIFRVINNLYLELHILI
jgi:hypothetical protein